MRLLILFTILFTYNSFAQFHEDNISRITEIDEAEAYAKRYGEVSFGLVNYQRDPWLFDDLDTTNLSEAVGSIKFLFNRGTKFLKDTSLLIAHIQVIELNEDQLTGDSMLHIRQVIDSLLLEGKNYWEIKRVVTHPGITYKSEPVDINEIYESYGMDHSGLKDQKFHHWQNSATPKSYGWIVMDKVPVTVPAFFAISFTKAG